MQGPITIVHVHVHMHMCVYIWLYTCEKYASNDEM